MSKAAGLGLTVMKPHGESMPYDVVVDNGSCLKRIQVKSTSYRTSYGFRIGMARWRKGKVKLYSASEVDFLAAYIIPEDVWYIIPIRALSQHWIRFYPSAQNKRSRYHRYREAWHLLGPGKSVRRIFAQAAPGLSNDDKEGIVEIVNLWPGYPQPCSTRELSPDF